MAQGLLATVAWPFRLDTRDVFVQHSVHITQQIEAVSAALARGPRTWFPRLEVSSLSAVGPRVAGVGLRKKVVVDVGEPVTTGGWTEIPITWRATYLEQLFPVMSGKVELAPVDRSGTRLTVSGMYEPPLGRVGEQLDAAFMHKVAEATVAELAESIANRLQAPTVDELERPD